MPNQRDYILTLFSIFMLWHKKLNLKLLQAVATEIYNYAEVIWYAHDILIFLFFMLLFLLLKNNFKPATMILKGW